MEERKIGDPAHIKNAPDIEATITAICHRMGGYTEYELSWMLNGELKVAWMSPLMLATEKKQGPIGFAGERK